MADSKLQNLNGGTANLPGTVDIGYLVNDPAGTPADGFFWLYDTPRAFRFSGPISQSGGTIIASLLDEDNFASDSATTPASQQSIGAYVSTYYLALTGGAVVGNVSITGTLTVLSGLNTLILGADASATSLTDNTTKVARMFGQHYDNDEEDMTGFVLESNAANSIAYFGGGTASGNAATIIVFYTAANTTTTTGTERMRIDSAGNLLIGTTTSPSANGGKVIVVGDNAANPTMGSNTAGFYGSDVTGTVEAFAIDEASNETQLTPHARNAPNWIYDRIPGIETVRMTRNWYRGEIEWTNETRKNILLQKQIEGEQLPTNKKKRTFHLIETFAEYNKRTGEKLKAWDWNKVQAQQEEQVKAAQKLWDADPSKTTPRPEDYKKKKKPDFLK